MKEALMSLREDRDLSPLLFFFSTPLPPLPQKKTGKERRGDEVVSASE